MHVGGFLDSCACDPGQWFILECFIEIPKVKEARYWKSYQEIQWKE